MLGITVNSRKFIKIENKKCYLLPIDTNHYCLLEELWVVNSATGNSARYLLDTANLCRSALTLTRKTKVNIHPPWFTLSIQVVSQYSANYSHI